jgi:hypothetical protein
MSGKREPKREENTKDGINWSIYENLLEVDNAEPPEGAITAQMLADRKGTTVENCRKQLEKLVVKGDLVKDIFNVDSRRKNYYWPVEKK